MTIREVIEQREKETLAPYAALAAEGFEKRKTSRGILVEGLHLKPWEEPAWQ